jgi:hypothetical protein
VGVVDGYNTLEWEIRGIPLWLIRDYLLELGGHEDDFGKVNGSGWKVSLEQIEDFQIGSVRVGQVRLIIDAEQGSFNDIHAALKKKLIRAGG